MKKITDQSLIHQLVLENEITKYLGECGYEFQLYKYERDEILINILEEIRVVEFVVKGSVQIYSLRHDGEKCPVALVEEFTLLGDVELYKNQPSPFLVEARTEVLCLVLPIKENREKLLEDNQFLRFCIRSLSTKLVMSASSETVFTSLEEKFLYYIREQCEGSTITSVENTAFHLRCSRRQLQRILKKLLEEEKIRKVKKGCYKLNTIEKSREGAKDEI